MGKMTELVQRQIFAYRLDVDQGKRAANIFWVWYVEKRYNSDVHNTDSGLNTYPKPNHKLTLILTATLAVTLTLIVYPAPNNTP